MELSDFNNTQVNEFTCQTVLLNNNQICRQNQNINLSSFYRISLILSMETNSWITPKTLFQESDLPSEQFLKFYTRFEICAFIIATISFFGTTFVILKASTKQMERFALLKYQIYDLIHLDIDGYYSMKSFGLIFTIYLYVYRS